MINDFRVQSNQLLPESFVVPYHAQQKTIVQPGLPSSGVNGWAQEFATGANVLESMEMAYQTPQPIGLNLEEYSRFQQIRESSSSTMNVDQHLEGGFSSQQSPPASMYLGMDFGLGSAGMRYMPITSFQPQHGVQNIKGKEKMIELDDENWEEQFKQIDLEGQKREAVEAKAIEDELNKADKVILESEMNDFSNFESIWRGIQAESSTAQELSEQNGTENVPDNYRQWPSFDGMVMPFQKPHLGDYMFEEDNLFKDCANPFEEGLRIMEDGGNLSLASLAFEAAVQRDSDHVNAWVMLGSAQAQNEKETPAIRALEQALKLDPANLTALMGLAVSYTNEGYDSTAYRTLERWLSFKYPDVVNSGQNFTAEPDLGYIDRVALHEKVTDLFIRAAQLSPDGEHMDPDVQVGLGVLFYGAEEYDKAVDCFSAALASTESGTSNQKDQLHLLWNRLGATLANSGRSEEAISAYEKALMLRSNFVRARYNLGVSCINIGCYDEAASHLLGALTMHRVVENEGRQKARDILDGNGTMTESELDKLISHNQSNNLYDTLRRVFSQMGRQDLSERVVIGMDVESFRTEFEF